MLYNTLGAQPFNYTDAVDALPNALHAFGGQTGNSEFISGSGLFADPLAQDVTSGTAHTNSFSSTETYANSAVSDAGTFVLGETALDMHCWGLNPVVVAKLQLNGQDRFSEREGTYFDQVQPFQHHTCPRYRYQRILIRSSPRRTPTIWKLQLLSY